MIKKELNIPQSLINNRKKYQIKEKLQMNLKINNSNKVFLQINYYKEKNPRKREMKY